VSFNHKSQFLTEEIFPPHIDSWFQKNFIERVHVAWSDFDQGGI